MASVVFRADASPTIGGGHIMRCLTLADRLKGDGWETAFYCTDETLETVPQLEYSGHRISISSSNEIDITDWLVVDHYGLGIDFERNCRTQAKKIMVLDDMPIRRHDCDILLDQNLGRASSDYDRLVPDAATVVTGPDYALLRPQFADARAAAISRTPSIDAPLNLLITMGMTDPDNATGRFLEALAKCETEIAVDVVLGPNAPHLDRVRQQMRTLAYEGTLYVGVDDMAGLLASRDLVIGSAGSSVWERSCLGVASLLVVLAENQRRIAEVLDDRDAAVNLGPLNDLTEKNLADKVRRVLQSPEKLAILARNAALVCDGLGAGRVLQFLDPELAKDDQPVTLRVMERNDGETLLAWQSDPGTRHYSRNPEIPDRKEHYAWLDSKLADPTVIFHIIEHQGRPSGMVRLDLKFGTPDTYEISILTAPDKYKLGIAKAALRAIHRLLPGATFLAEVHPENTASQLLFTSAGFTFEDNHYIRRSRAA